jgi:hypothetical protein
MYRHTDGTSPPGKEPVSHQNCQTQCRQDSIFHEEFSNHRHEHQDTTLHLWLSPPTHSEHTRTSCPVSRLWGSSSIHCLYICAMHSGQLQMVHNLCVCSPWNQGHAGSRGGLSGFSESNLTMALPQKEGGHCGNKMGARRLQLELLQNILLPVSFKKSEG